jgi:SH3-like domain-containing protein
MMILNPFRGLGFYAAIAVMGLGAFALLPGDDSARPAVDRIATVEPDPARPSYIVKVTPAPIEIDTVETASVAQPSPAPTGQEMPAPLTAELEPVTTASLTINTPPAGSDEFPMEAVEPQTEAAVVPPDAERLSVSSAVNMRAGPSTSTSTIMVLRAGEPVAVIGRNRGWVNVALADGQSGWVYERYLSDGSRRAEPDDMEQTASVDRERRRERVVEDDDGYVIRRTVELRDRPSRSGTPLFRIRRGEPVEIAEVRGNWVRIRVDGGISGWVQARYIGD